MKKTEKPFLVEDLKKRFEDAKSVVALDYQGLTVKELNSLRNTIREAGGKLVVAKNTLLKLALQKVSKEGKVPKVSKAFDTSDIFGTFDTFLQGPTAVVFAEEDEITPLQKLGKFMAEKGLPKLKFGIFGTDVFDGDRLLALAKLPGRNVLLAMLVGTIAGPQYGLVRVLNINLQRLVYILSIKSKVTS